MFVAVVLRTDSSPGFYPEPGCPGGGKGAPHPSQTSNPHHRGGGLSSLGQLNQKRKTGHVWAVISSIQEQMWERTATPKQDSILLTEISVEIKALFSALEFFVSVHLF